MKHVKHIILSILLSLLLCASALGGDITVKYGPKSIDPDALGFEYLDTSRSSFVTGAWYDPDKNYMIIGLAGTYYHYCKLPQSTWEQFKRAPSFGRYYNGFIKGRFDCRNSVVPEY